MREDSHSFVLKTGDGIFHEGGGVWFAIHSGRDGVANHIFSGFVGGNLPEYHGSGGIIIFHHQRSLAGEARCDEILGGRRRLVATKEGFGGIHTFSGVESESGGTRTESGPGFRQRESAGGGDRGLKVECIGRLNSHTILGIGK